MFSSLLSPFTPFFQVSNFNLYYLGKKIGLQEYLLSEKFEPTENWLPPGYVISEDYEPIQGSVATVCHLRWPVNI